MNENDQPRTESEAPKSEHPRSAPATTKPRAPKIALAVAAVAIAGAAVATVALRSAGGAPKEPPSAPDVPRAEGAAILFSKGFRERAGVKTAALRSAPLTPVIKVNGTVTFDPQHVAAVGTRIRGLVRKLGRIEGDAVVEGEVLAEIESAELGDAQASVTMIHAQKKAAELNATREIDLAGRKLSTAREAEVAQASLDEHKAMLGAAHQRVAALGGATAGPFGVYLLRAPLTGTVVERHIAAGQSVEGNLVAYQVADLDHLWIELAVFESNLAAIRRDDAVEVRPLATPEASIRGKVAYVGDEIDQTTRSATVRIKVDNTPRLLRPGQAVTARLHASGPARSALLLPTSAVTFVDGKPTVFVESGEGRVVPTPVVLGATNGDEQEIASGLAEGAIVVSEGVFALKSELYR
jgi:cobalt-zinc-cadmium efflux system membrane fusion protein